MEAAESGLYETVQFPLSYLATEQELGPGGACAPRAVSALSA